MADRYPASNSDAGEMGHLDERLLTAFVDGDIDDEDVLARVRAHLIRCDQCRQDVAELRALVSLFGDLPEPALPRSFRVEPSMVPVRIAPGATEPAWYIRYQPVLRRMTALAAVLLVSVLMVDVLVNSGALDRQDADDSAPASESVTTASSGAGSSAESNALAETPVTESGSDVQSSGGAAAATQESAAVTDSATESSISGAAATATSAATEATGGNAGDAQPTEETVPAVLQSQTEEAASREPDATAEVDASINASDSTAVSESDTETIATTDGATDQGTSILAIAELALALIVIWLLVVTVLLPRIRPAQR